MSLEPIKTLFPTQRRTANVAGMITPIGIRFTRTFIPWGFRGKAAGVYPFGERTLGSIISSIFNDLIPEHAFGQKPLIDISGSESPPHRMMQIQGEVMDEDDTPKPFSVSLITPFLAFIDGAHISYRVVIEKHGAYPTDRTIKELLFSEEVMLRRFELSMTFFEPHYSRFSGPSPRGTRTLLLESKDNHLLAEFTAEAPRKELCEKKIHDLNTKILTLLT